MIQQSARYLARLAAGAALLWAAQSALAGDIYVYQSSDGSRLITDHPRIEAGYRLVKVYSEAKLWYQTGQTQRKRRPLKPQPSAFDELIAGAAKRVSLDPLLIKSVMHAESAFDPNAVSRKGASGLMQLMPGTARRYGVTRIFNPRENVMGGAEYLSDLLDRFNGRLELALAGYNAGENAVSERGGVPPYAETRRYVKKVLRLYQEYKDEQCGRHRVDVSPKARIISCSRSPRGTSTTKLANVEVSEANTVSSADERQWRPIE